jgi:secreted trypsin-like serine protease
MYTARISLLLALTALGSFGCAEEVDGIELDESVGESSDDIIGGKDSTRSDVVGILMFEGDQVKGLCSGTLIAPRAVLTAGHCVDPDDIGKNTTLAVFFGADLDNPGTIIRAKKATPHPKYSASKSPLGDGIDVGVIELESASDVTPATLNTSAIPKSLKSVKAYGYGRSSNKKPNAIGERKVATLNVDSVEKRELEIGKKGKVTCSGDSGGPSFATVGGKSNVLVGVHSWSRIQANKCTGLGGDVRVDQNMSFIAPFLDLK